HRQARARSNSSLEFSDLVLDTPGANTGYVGPWAQPKTIHAKTKANADEIVGPKKALAEWFICISYNLHTKSHEGRHRSCRAECRQRLRPARRLLRLAQHERDPFIQ